MADNGQADREAQGDVEAGREGSRDRATSKETIGLKRYATTILIPICK
jgi:hypothetical protein